MSFIDGKLMVWDFFNKKWLPVKVNGRFFEYQYTFYFCDESLARTFDVPAGCPYEVSVKDEIISLDPPQIKEIYTETATWWTNNGLGPRPRGTVSGGLMNLVLK